MAPLSGAIARRRGAGVLIGTAVSATRPLESHRLQIKLGGAAAKIETAELLVELQIGRAEFWRPLVGEHRPAEMIAIDKFFEVIGLGGFAEWRDVAIQFILVQVLVSRRYTTTMDFPRQCSFIGR